VGIKFGGCMGPNSPFIANIGEFENLPVLWLYYGIYTKSDTVINKLS
jgi:hypothetical protein